MNVNEMRFGLQKMTLLDYPGRVACTVFTRGCDFRCPFCHNGLLALPGMPTDGLLTADEVLAFLRKRQGVLDGVCVTGGEPLMQAEIFDFLGAVKALGYAVKLDTNGSYPERLKEAAARKLIDAVAMDIKNAPEKYALTAGVSEEKNLLERIRASVDFLKQSAIPHEFRTTVVTGLHEASDFDAIGQWLGAGQPYFLQRFVNTVELIGGFEPMSVPTEEEMNACLAAARKWIPEAAVRGMD